MSHNHKVYQWVDIDLGESFYIDAATIYFGEIRATALSDDSIEKHGVGRFTVALLGMMQIVSDSWSLGWFRRVFYFGDC